MNELYTHNISFLRENFPGLYRQLQDKRDEGTNLEIAPAKASDSLYITLTTSDGVKVHLNSKFDPLKEARLWAEQQKLSNVRHILLFGLGLGYHAEALLAEYPDILLYIYDPDACLFLRTLSYRDWSTFPWARVKFGVCDQDVANLTNFLSQIIPLVKKDWEVIIMPAFERCFPATVLTFKRQWKLLADEYINQLTTNLAFEKDWTLNAIKNLPFVLKCDDIFTYQDFFKNRDVVMVASGPSLAEALPYLRKIKDNRNAIILAVGSSINRLLDSGLQPDAVCAYDPSLLNYEVLKSCMKTNIPFIFGTTIFADVIRDYEGPKAYFVLSQDTVQKYFWGQLPQGRVVDDAPSIAVVMLDLLGKLGVGRVVLAGQDLAFYQEQIYAEGTTFLRPGGKKTAEDTASQLPVMANDGQTVYTWPAFNGVRRGLEAVVKHSVIHEIWNTAEHGAKIEGVPYIPWIQVIEQLASPTKISSLDFKEHKADLPLRRVKKNLWQAIETLRNNFKQLDRWIDRFIDPEKQGDSDDLEKTYQNIDKTVVRLTSSPEYNVFIAPMVRNSVHLLKKVLPDIPLMSLDERKSFVKEDLLPYLGAVKLAILELCQVYDTW